MNLKARHLHGADGALHDVSLEIEPGKITVLRGAPDSGHDLLLRLLSLLESPSAGDVLLDDVSTVALAPAALATLRTRQFGYVFADPFLLPGFSLVENLAMPLFKILQLSLAETRPRVERWLQFVGLAQAAEFPAGELPAEAQHLAALARALGHEPAFLIVEKLDAQRGLLDFLPRIRALGTTTIIATASPRALAAPADRIIELAHGRVVAS